MPKKFNDPSRQIPIDPSILYVGEMLIDITDDMVPNVYDYYMISNFGRVYHKYLGIFMSPGVSGSGYLFVYLSTYNGPKMIQLHRLVLMAFKPIQNPEDFQGGCFLCCKPCRVVWAIRHRRPSFRGHRR